MSAAQQGSQQQPTAWTEPPWSGWIETTGDALLILEAARRGLIPRVTRRLVDAERKMITSGSVFVFDEDESGIKRWTDGLFWSPSRILGNFLLYRETDKRGHRTTRADPDDSSDSMKPDGTLSRPKSEHTNLGIDKQRERTLLGSLTNSYKFKPDGLMKKTFSLTIGGVAQHLISYYKIEDVENGRLRSPSSLPELAALAISAEYLDKTHFRNPPKVEVGSDGILRYCGEGDEMDPPSSASSSTTPNPLASSLPLLTDGHIGATDASSSSKRPKRFLPYGPANRHKKKSTKSPIEGPAASTSSTPAPTPESTSGPVLLSTPPQPASSHIPPVPPNVPAHTSDTSAAPAAPSSYPTQYPYFPPAHAPPPPMGYQPHLGAPVYPQPGYPAPPPPPPSAPQSTLAGAMNPHQMMPPYGYGGYPQAPPSMLSPIQNTHSSPPPVQQPQQQQQQQPQQQQQDHSGSSPSVPPAHPGRGGGSAPPLQPQPPHNPQPYYPYYPPPPPQHQHSPYGPYAPQPGQGAPVGWQPYPPPGMQMHPGYPPPHQPQVQQQHLHQQQHQPPPAHLLSPRLVAPSQGGEQLK
ncbi:Gti1/Pac2 family-domain-containing protein [Ephemerocybe angulata]|uniref:Gti1/Pac2 family-domain-containing protein n=1 Tax=Ephemerocybe angulata TaxID=980116 RepID=A0A8H6HTR8_9AGAR|nr:Gti1/Pac2 family-domain-containing protein [Tulosesus angulatus]